MHFLFRMHAGHALVARNLIWWVLDRVVGTRAEIYHLTAVATHLVTVVLWFGVVRRLTGSAWAACVAALLWGSAPVQEASVGWYAVYGQVLATALLVWVLSGLARMAQGGAAFTARLAVAWTIAALLMVTSFGVGLGMVAVLPVVAWLVLPRGSLRWRVVGVLATASLAAPLVYWGLVRVHERLFGADVGMAVVHGDLATPLAIARLVAVLLRHGIGALLGAVVAGRLDGAHPLVGIAGAALVAAFVAASGRERRQMLAGLVLAVGCYAPIAAGRVTFWLRGTPYDAEPRFQYAATLALSLVVAAAFTAGSRRLSLPGPAVRVVTLALAVLMLGCQLWLRAPFDHFVLAHQEADAVQASIRTAIEAAKPGEDVYIDAGPFAAVGLVSGRLPRLFPGWAGVFVVFYPANVVDGRRVRFVTTPDVVEALGGGRRTADLLVTERP